MTKQQALEVVIGMAQAYQQNHDFTEEEMVEQNDALDMVVLIQQEIQS